MPKPVIRFRIDFAKHCSVGPGKIDLLEAIRASGSLSQAARDLGMSYRRAWLLVDSFKLAFREPVTLATTGGKGGGGVALTPFGANLVDRYRALEREFDALASRRLRHVGTAVQRPAVKSPQSRRPLTRRSARA